MRHGYQHPIRARKRRKSAFSFEIPAILKHDYSLATGRDLKCMYMPMWAHRRAHITHVRIAWYRPQISAQYLWARTFMRGHVPGLW